MRRVPIACIGVVAWTSGFTAVGQVKPAESQDRLLARRAAEADAYRRLAEAMGGLQITSELFVRDFVAESDQIAAALDGVVERARLGPPTYADDGRCTVVAELELGLLVPQLKDIHRRHYRGERIRIGDFDGVEGNYRDGLIRVVGTGIARLDLPPGLPAGVDAALGPDVPASAAGPRLPAIWERVPAQERLMTVRAARLDAQRRLLERIGGLRVSADTLVRDFVTESDEVRTHADGIVVGAREKGPPYYHDDELVVEVTLEAAVESVISSIRELHVQHYRGERVRVTDIERLRDAIRSETFEAIGVGVPRPQIVAAVTQEAGIFMPDWSTRPIEAVGECTDPAIDTPQGKLKAVRCAELDARRRISEHIDGLAIDARTRVGDVVGPRAELRAQLHNAIVGSVVDTIDVAGSAARVRVSVHGADVWSVVHDHWRSLQR